MLRLGEQPTKITALVEPPDEDLGLMAREGGCRLMFGISLLVVWQ